MGGGRGGCSLVCSQYTLAGIDIKFLSRVGKICMRVKKKRRNDNLCSLLL